jgi:hypothetical protein
MANGFDPRIALQVRPPNVGRTFTNILQNIGQIQGLQQQQQEAPFRQQILEAQAGQAQQQLDLQRFQSVALGAQEILPDLLADNPQAALQKLQARRQRLISQGRATQDTDQAIQMIQTPEGQLQLTEDAQNVVNQATQQGLLGSQQLTARQRELEQLRLLPENTEEERQFKERFARAIGAEAKTLSTDEKIRLAREKEDIKTTGAGERATITTRNKLIEETKALPEQERVRFLSTNRDNFQLDISESRRVLDEIDRAIEIWETAPGTISGPFASRLPALAAETQELESILAGLGIDRLANFKGATSERELATAFRAGASIEQDKTAGIRRLQKQRNDITRNNDRLRGLLNESNALLRRQPQQTTVQQTDESGTTTIQQTSQFQEGQTAVNPQTGERIVFKNGQWVPFNG